MSDDEVLLGNSLKSSKESFGSLYPILLDFHGNIIDGQHRFEADQNWPKRRLEHIKTEKDKIFARLICNACRRTISAKEKTRMLDKLGQIFLGENVAPGKVSKKIAEATGMSYRWVMKYLPKKYKNKQRAFAAYRAAKNKKLTKILNPPQERLVQLTPYQNTNFAYFIIRKPLYKRIERASKILDTTAEILLQNTIEEKLREIRALERTIEKAAQAENIIADPMPLQC